MYQFSAVMSNVEKLQLQNDFTNTLKFCTLADRNYDYYSHTHTQFCKMQNLLTTIKTKKNYTVNTTTNSTTSTSTCVIFF